jgi:hypothetical protein
MKREKGQHPLSPFMLSWFTTIIQPAPGKTPSPIAGNTTSHAASQLSHKVLPHDGTRDLARAAIH